MDMVNLCLLFIHRLEHRQSYHNNSKTGCCVDVEDTDDDDDDVISGGDGKEQKVHRSAAHLNRRGLFHTESSFFLSILSFLFSVFLTFFLSFMMLPLKKKTKTKVL